VIGSGLGGTTGRGSTGGSQAPSNPLWRILYEIGRPLGFVAGASEELYRRGTEEGYQPTNVIKAGAEGFMQHKTFGDFVEDPVAAFIADVAADPITWIPGGWVAKGVKTPLKLGERAAVASGFTKLPVVESVLDAAKIARHEVKLRINKAYRLGLWDKNQEIRVIQEENALAHGRAERVLHDAWMDASNYLAENDQEARSVFKLLIKTPPEGDLAKSIQDVAPYVAAEYNGLSEGGKKLYKLGLAVQKKYSNFKITEGMLSSERAQGYINKWGQYYPTMFVGALEKAIKGMKADKLMMRAKKGALAADDIIELSEAVPEAYRGLGKMAIQPNNLKQFLGKISQVSENSPVMPQIKDLWFDERRLDFLRAKETIEKNLINAGQPSAMWPVEMLRHVAAKPHGEIAKAIRVMSEKRLFADKNLWPREEDLLHLAEYPARTPYKGMRGFFQSVKSHITYKDSNLKDLKPRDIPIDIFGTKTEKAIDDMLDEMRLMSTPEEKELIQKATKFVEENPSQWDGWPRAWRRGCRDCSCCIGPQPCS